MGVVATCGKAPTPLRKPMCPRAAGEALLGALSWARGWVQKEGDLQTRLVHVGHGDAQVPA